MFGPHVKGADRGADRGTGDEAASARLVDALISSLSPRQGLRFSNKQSLEVMHRSLLSIVEAEEEGVLTKSEADALAKYLVSKFVDQRLCQILEDIFDAHAA